MSGYSQRDDINRNHDIAFKIANKVKGDLQQLGITEGTLRKLETDFSGRFLVVRLRGMHFEGNTPVDNTEVSADDIRITNEYFERFSKSFTGKGYAQSQDRPYMAHLTCYTPSPADILAAFGINPEQQVTQGR